MEDYGLISVIIPVYNVEKYLRQCLDSVLNQTYTNYEVIMVDDGSTDSSYDICREYCEKDCRFKAFHKENGGASSARNYALSKASGDYVFFLDSDDWLDPTTLESLVVVAKKENADLVFCEAQAFDDHGTITQNSSYGYKIRYQTNDAFHVMSQMMEQKEFHVAIWMLLLDRRIFTENDLHFKEGIIYEDMIISYQFYCLAHRAAHVRQKLYNRRYRPNSVMTSKKTEKNYVSAATVYREVAKFRKSLPEEKQSPQHLIRCAFNVLNIYRQMTPDIQKKYQSDYQDIIQDILNNDAYGDKSLKLDSKSHLLWGAYKVFRKVFK
jgi:glycosyltransferase involved in cell wall biosynthesis